MEVWPGTLQQTLNVDNFSVKFGNTLVRTEVDGGPSKVRSRYTDGVDTYTCSIFLDYDQFIYLRNFYKTTLNNGSKPFQFLNPLTNVTDVFRFVDPPDIRPLGGRTFSVSMTWERLP